MLKRFILLSLLAALLLSATAQAAEWGRLMTPKTPLNVRKERSLDSERVTTIMPGEQVRADFEKDGWCAVFRPGVKERRQELALGYVNAGYLVPADEWGELRSPHGMLNIRRERSLSSAHVRTLGPEDVVRVDFEKDGWVAVFAPDEKIRSESRAIGYSNSRYLFPATDAQIRRVQKAEAGGGESAAAAPAASAETAPAAPATPAVEPAAPEQKPQPVSSGASSSHWGRLVKLSRRVNVRAERTADSKLVETLKEGQAVRVDFLRKGWYAAFKPGETRRDEKHALGYIYAALIEDDLGPLPEMFTAERQPSEPAGDVRPEAHFAPESDGAPSSAGGPLYQVRSAVRNEPPQELAEAAPKAAPVEDAGKGAEDGGDTVVEAPEETPMKHGGPTLEKMVVDPSRAGEPEKSPAPKADQVRHGFRYALMERQESREGRYPLDILRIYLDVSVVPDDAALSDFCSTLWKEQWRQGTLMRVDIYLPDMDLRDLSYAEAMFDGKGLRQFWTREAVLFGTRFRH